MPPVIAPIVAGAGALAGALGITTTQLAIGILATAARVGLSYYQAEKAKREASSGRTQASRDIQQNLRQATYPRYVVLGKARVGGVVWFYESSKEKMYVATILSDDVIDGVDAYYLNEIEVLLNASNQVTTPPFQNSGEKYVTFELHYGYTDQDVSEMLFDAFGSTFTSDFRASGVAYLVAEFQQPPQEDFQTVFNSTVPPIGALVRGVLAYDPRDEVQNPGVSSTWTTTTNPAILLLYYLTASNGMGLSRTLFDGDLFGAVADFCDELVDTKTGGRRKRYEMGGVYSYADDPVDIIEDILRTFGGSIFVTADGLFGLSCDELDVPEITITDDMITEIDAKRRTGALYEYTTIKSRFTSEAHGYVENGEEADPWTDADTRARIGREIPYSFDLPYVFRHDQARRLMKREWNRLNPEWTLDLAVDFNGLELFGERTCRIVYPALGIDGTFRLESVTPDDEQGFGKIIVKATSIAAEAFEWDYLTEEGTAPATAPATAESAAPQVPTNVASLVGNDGGTIVALITWDSVTPTGITQKAQYKLTSAGTWTNISGVARTDRGATISGLTGGSSYDVRIRTQSSKYGVSAWATHTFTATAVGGSTTALTSLTGSGLTLKATATAVQSSAATAAYVEFTIVASGDPVDWTGSITKEARADDSVSATFSDLEAGDYDFYARSLGINGDVSSRTGPVTVTVTATIDTGGSGGSGGGSGGDGKNDGGGGTSSGGGGGGGGPVGGGGGGGGPDGGIY